jgi:hypothetical protein
MVVAFFEDYEAAWAQQLSATLEELAEPLIVPPDFAGTLCPDYDGRR